ncbi:MAG: sulfatase-like hydrolase/transferase, partial [Holophagales bacterium]|nr:sulfatase-like hydrolase/transferase [Holophagales bacterium]
GRLLDELDELDETDRTIVVMTADHGEGHGEHGEETHALLAHDATLHVPLIVKVPGRSFGEAGEESRGRRIAERVGTVDIAPTLLELLGRPIPGEMQGRSLVPLLASDGSGEEPGAEPANRRPYYAETLSPRLSHGWGELRAWYEGPWKYVHGPRPELYHLASDPGERDERGAAEPEVAASMRSRLAGYLARTSRPLAADAVPGADPEVRARLEALGYVSSGGAGPESITDVLRDDGTPPQDRVRDLSQWSRAKHHLTRGEHLAAKDAVAPLLDTAPDNAVYRMLAAWAEMGLGHDRDAAQLLRGTDIPARYGPLVARLAGRLAGRGERDTALELLDQVLAAQPTAPVWKQRAQLFRGRDPAEFERSLEAALAVDGAFAPARIELATALAERGEHGAAAEHFVAALEQDPLSARGHHNYGALLAGLGQWPAARRHFARAVELAPVSCSHRLALLTAEVELGDSEPAVAVRRGMDGRCGKAEIEQAEALLEELAARGGLFEVLAAMEEPG